MTIKNNLFLFTILWSTLFYAQRKVDSDGYWQQYVNYKMDVDMDVARHSYHGKQIIRYKNNSPDTLKEIYLHLYWRAFRPGSALYWHNKTLPDPDERIEKIKKLKPDESGEYTFHSVKQDGKKVKYTIDETVMRIQLNKPLIPGATTEITTDYDCQIPKFIRRSGYMSPEGIEFNMAQWYPKVAEYDKDGWHADPFLGREFYGVWGDFFVTIHIDSAYTIGGTGYLVNPKEIGKGYADVKVENKPKKLTWQFLAPHVHDFSFAADKHFVHTTYPGPAGVKLHFFYVPSSKSVRDNWSKLPEYAAKAMAFYNEKIGKYPYAQYSIIQAGDGGMEYGMCTFITGKRFLPSLIGVTMHEMAHSWFQFVLATDETRHPWMDEGFTTFISTWAYNELAEKHPAQNFMKRTIRDYIRYAQSGFEEPVAMYSDYYRSNVAYWLNAYNKGALFLWHLMNIAGKEKTVQFLQAYFDKWKFRHPQPEDMLRTAEKATGMQLHWFYNQWIESTHHVEYAVDSVVTDGRGKSRIILKKNAAMPVPLDVLVETDKGTFVYHIPYFRTLQYRKTDNVAGTHRFAVLKPWFDGFPTYEITVPSGVKKIKKVEIDPLQMTCDIDRSNNVWKK